MTAIKIEIPTTNTSKAEEIAILEKLTDSFQGTQSFLADLFTPELMKFFRTEVEKDFVPNIMEHYASDTAVAIAQATEAHRQFGKELDVEIKLRVNAELELGKAREELDRVTKSADFYAFQTESIRETANEAIDLASARKDEMEAMNEQIEKLQQRVIELKARIYDLTN